MDSGEVAVKHHQETEQEEQDGNLVHSMHHTQIDILRTALEQIHRIQIVEELLEKHGKSC
jgi:methionyl-tRNA formyltransferase